MQNALRTFLDQTKLSKMIRISIIVVFTVLSSAATQSVPDEGVVTKVYDGDTIQLDSGHRVRYTGIDTAEVGEEYHDNATRLNSQLVLGKKVRLEYDKEHSDRYDRLLAYVFVIENGKEVLANKRIVEEGFAGMYYARPQMRYFKELLEAQRIAIKKKLGLWRYRLLETENEYVGSKKSYTFHRKYCKSISKLKPSNKVKFVSKADAYMQGYSACRSCKP